MTWIFRTTSNAPESCTMQALLRENAHKVCHCIVILNFLKNISLFFNVIVSIYV